MFLISITQRGNDKDPKSDKGGMLLQYPNAVTAAKESGQLLAELENSPGAIAHLPDGTTRPLAKWIANPHLEEKKAVVAEPSAATAVATQPQKPKTVAVETPAKQIEPTAQTK